MDKEIQKVILTASVVSSLFTLIMLSLLGAC